MLTGGPGVRVHRHVVGVQNHLVCGGDGDVDQVLFHDRLLILWRQNVVRELGVRRGDGFLRGFFV